MSNYIKSAVNRRQQNTKKKEDMPKLRKLLACQNNSMSCSWHV